MTAIQEAKRFFSHIKEYTSIVKYFPRGKSNEFKTTEIKDISINNSGIRLSYKRELVLGASKLLKAVYTQHSNSITLKVKTNTGATILYQLRGKI